MVVTNNISMENRPVRGGFSGQARRIALPFSRVQLACPVSSSSDVETNMAAIRRIVLPWLQSKADRPLPAQAWDGQTFTFQELGAQPTEAVAFEGTWAARNDDSKNTDSRIFVTEIILTADSNAIHFGVNLTVVEPPDSLPINRTVPRFVRRVATELGFSIDGRPVSTNPWIVADDKNVSELVDLLTSPSRNHPVCVVSLPEGSEDPSDALLPAEDLQHKVAGAAHVVVLTSYAANALTSFLGERLSVFRGAVRTYEAGLDPSDWSPGRHRLALARSIENWEGGSASFGNFLVDNILKLTAYRPARRDRATSYLDVKQQFQDHLLTRSESNTTLEQQYANLLSVNTTLRQRITEQEETYGPIYEEAIQGRDDARRELWGFRSRVEQLEMVRFDTNVSEQELVIPNDFNALDEWAGTHLDGRGVVVAKKAIDAAKESPFEDVALAYRALVLLRDYYVTMKRRDDADDAFQNYNEERQRLMLEDGAAANRASAGQYGKDYYVHYDGRKLLLDRHLRKGNVHDPKRTFALYFCWDDETRQVIVGSLPNHLTTARS